MSYYTIELFFWGISLTFLGPKSCGLNLDTRALIQMFCARQSDEK